MKDKTRVIILYKKEQEILGKVEELMEIQDKLNNLKESLKIKSESLREMVKAYKKLHEELQKSVSDKSIKIGKYLEFYDYPKLIFKVNGEDIFAKSASLKEGLFKEGCELEEAREEK
jgi:hypothetical protein